MCPSLLGCCKKISHNQQRFISQSWKLRSLKSRKVSTDSVSGFFTVCPHMLKWTRQLSESSFTKALETLPSWQLAFNS
jgi:hypothetical protein